MNARRLLLPAVLLAMTLAVSPVSAQFIEDFQFNDPIGIQWLDNKTLVVASAHDSQLRIIDIEKWEAFSICECK